MTRADRQLNAAIAATRFGLGARPGEIATASGDPRGWLKAQIRPQGADQPATDGQTIRDRIAALREFQEQQQALRKAAARSGDPQANQAKLEAGKEGRRDLREDMGEDFLARVKLATSTDASFRERWTLFWANHFTVSAIKLETAVGAGPFENEAIRPHVFDRFGALLAAVESHPTMLFYLDQSQSVGPDSPLAQRAMRIAYKPNQPRRALGLNENLAREIMELHTVGVNGGYTQADVTEFARAMTGLSVAGPRDPNAVLGETVFREAAHEPGVRTIMGVKYASGGKEQVEKILHDLATRPSTAKFVCTKIARHFVSDDPPPALVARLQKAWMRTDGDLSAVAEALIDAPEAWAPAESKFKTPYDFVVSSYRAVGAAPQDVKKVTPILTALGQKPFSPGSPKGWPDVAGDWASPDGVVKRMQYAQGFAAVAGPVLDPKQVAAEALGERLTPATATAIARAESRAEGLALLLMSPEFQRR